MAGSSATAWVDVKAAKAALDSFLDDRSTDLSKLGRTINQIFEAFALVSAAQYYKNSGWNVEIVNPKKKSKDSSGQFEIIDLGVRLKFSTRGRPSGYTYFRCEREKVVVEIRHQLRVQTHWAYCRKRRSVDSKCNVCLDVAIVKPFWADSFGTDASLSNSDLISFGEAKHMHGYAELVASYVGLVHEMQPWRLRKARKKEYKDHISPFMFLSGDLYRTGSGLSQSIARRGYDIKIFTRSKQLVDMIGDNSTGTILTHGQSVDDDIPF